MEQNERRFAVLIDADNVSPKYIKYILDEVSDVGIATYKRTTGQITKSAAGRMCFWTVRKSHPAVQLHHRKERH